MEKPNDNRLYPGQVRAIVEALQAIFEQQVYADKAVEQILKADKRRGAHDRAIIAENTYEIVRWYRLLTAILGHYPRNEGDWWKLFAIRQHLIGNSIPRWEEFQGISAVAVRKRWDELSGNRSIRESIPDWLDEVGSKELGKAWGPTLQALNALAPVVLRVNTLVASLQKVQQALYADGIETVPLNEEALVVRERRNLFQTQPFKAGWFEVQDFSSQQVGPFLQVEPGMRVIDACAGAGGKSLHIAALMQNKGQLLALDTHPWKLEELRKRARRAKVHVIEARPIASSKSIKRLAKSADRVLLDVPCSGLGVLRRNPDAKWKLSPEFLNEVRATQAEILSSYSRMVKPGGKLVYATCSILPSENQEQVKKFLASQAGQDFTLEEQRTILPQEAGFDGFFFARLVRKAEPHAVASTSQKAKRPKSSVTTEHKPVTETQARAISAKEEQPKPTKKAAADKDTKKSTTKTTPASKGAKKASPKAVAEKKEAKKATDKAMPAAKDVKKTSAKTVAEKKEAKKATDKATPAAKDVKKTSAKTAAEKKETKKATDKATPAAKDVKKATSKTATNPKESKVSAKKTPPKGKTSQKKLPKDPDVPE